jgi:hypothetical protein
MQHANNLSRTDALDLTTNNTEQGSMRNGINRAHRNRDHRRAAHHPSLHGHAVCDKRTTADRPDGFSAGAFPVEHHPEDIYLPRHLRCHPGERTALRDASLESP